MPDERTVSAMPGSVTMVGTEVLEAVKTPVRRFFQEVVSGPHRVDVCDEIIAGDVCLEHPMLEEPIRNRQEFKDFVAMFIRAFPDLSCDIKALIAEGDLTATCIRASGTQKEEFYGVAPTGRRVDWLVANFMRVKDGRITEIYCHEDTYNLLKKLGKPI